VLYPRRFFTKNTGFVGLEFYPEFLLASLFNFSSGDGGFPVGKPHISMFWERYTEFHFTASTFSVFVPYFISICIFLTYLMTVSIDCE
jgi:hypothetical protein